MILLGNMAMSNSQRYPEQIYLINNMEDIVVVLGLKVFDSNKSYPISSSRNVQVTFVEKPHLKIISFFKYKH